jgi:hypothetical protein
MSSEGTDVPQRGGHIRHGSPVSKTGIFQPRHVIVVGSHQ